MKIMKKIYEKPEMEMVEVELETMIAQSIGVSQKNYDGNAVILGKERSASFDDEAWDLDF